jgi:hypothetical protein
MTPADAEDIQGPAKTTELKSPVLKRLFAFCECLLSREFSLVEEALHKKFFLAVGKNL